MSALPCDWVAGLETRRADHRAGRAYRAAFAAAADFVGRRYGESLCSFVAGSYATETATEYSDVDIFVIDERFASALREQLIYDSYPLQVAAMSAAYALGLTDSCRRRGALSFVPAFAVGKKLSGRDDVFCVVTGAAKRALALGPDAIPAARVARARVAVINNYLKVASGCDDAAMRFGACTKLIHSTARYIQLSAGTWTLNEVRYEDVLRSSPEYEAVVRAAPAALAGDVAGLLASVHAILRSRGELLWGTESCGLLPWLS
jgi:hypothetical protein